MNNISAARKAAGFSQKQLALEIGVSAPTVSEWESGKKSPRSANLSKLSELLNASSDYLLGLDEREKTPKKGIWINVFGRVAAGIPFEAIEDIVDQEELTPEMAAKGEYFGLIIHGQSMEPRFREGDTIIVLRQSDVESGEIAVVMVNGSDATCKKVVKQDNGISLVSTNPVFDPMFYTKKQVFELPVTILGKVVELRAKF